MPPLVGVRLKVAYAGNLLLHSNCRRPVNVFYNLVPRGLSSSHPLVPGGGKRRDPGNEVVFSRLAICTNRLVYTKAIPSEEVLGSSDEKSHRIRF